jgi:hypothetical protein
LKPVSFPAFYLQWGDMVGWQVPDCHLEAADWMENGRKGRVGVLKAFRGFSKSTLSGRYLPWRLRRNRDWLFSVLSATDRDAGKMSRDARFVIRRHPWCNGMKPEKGGLWKVHAFEVEGSSDARNPNVSAYGVMSNYTGSRVDEFLLDDVEVPKTIRTPALREAIRERIAETTHILRPGGKILYIGTDHCIESIYKEQIESGADLLEIAIYRRQVTYFGDGLKDSFIFDWRAVKEGDLYIVRGLNKPQMLDPSQYQVFGLKDYRGGYVKLKTPLAPEERVSIYADPAWPARFTREEITFRMSRCRSWGEWDSQYMLRPAHLGKVRLDPKRLMSYGAQPELRRVNGQLTMWLNGVRMVGASAFWDPSLGKPTSDTSAFSVVFTDSNGYLYWHVAKKLTGEVDEQCQGIVPEVKRLSLRGINLEVNGPGGFVPAILRRHLKMAGLDCAVNSFTAKVSKNSYILDALEPPLSGMFLHAHESVIDAVSGEMRDWDPTVKDQPDDYINSAAGAIAHTPVRIGNNTQDSGEIRDDWRPGSGTVEVKSDF